MQWNMSGSKLCEVPTPPPESERRVQVSIIAFVGERFCLLVNVELSKYLGCIALYSHGRMLVMKEASPTLTPE